MSVTIYSPKPDNGNQISGLCGNFNGNPNDDFHFEGIGYNDADSFVENLR
jgi:hypothetical protein